MEFDSNAEIRSMILTSSPLVPLPINSCRIHDDMNLAVINTHDVLSKLIEEGLKNKDNNRKSRQEQVLRNFVQDLVQSHAEHADGKIPTDQLYNIYCKHTISQIETYFPQGVQIPINLRDWKSVEKGDSVHKQMCAYMAGQSILLELPKQKSEDWEKYSYADLLQEAKNRIVFEGSNDYVKSP